MWYEYCYLIILLLITSSEGFVVKHVSNAISFRDGINNASFPMVWRQGAFQFVPSASLWSSENDAFASIQQKDRIEHDIRTTDRYFTYWDDKMTLSKYVTRSEAYERKESSLNFFRTHVTKLEPSPPFVRYGGPLKNISRHLFEYDEPHNIENIFDKSRMSLSVFWGGPGVVSTSHFDFHHNVYMLVWGEKEFVFAHPDEWSKFRPFPSIHPHARQGQLHFESSSFVSDDNTSRQKNRIQLKRGDVLYIPPGWIHHVRSGNSGMHLALSASMLTETHVRMNEWFSLYRGSPAPIPFLSNNWKWSFENVLGVLNIFFRHVNESSLNISFKELLFQTYSPSVRSSLGLPRSYDPRRPFPCPGKLAIDLEIATLEATKKMVALYENISTSWEQREFLKPLFEGILERLGGKMLLGLDFIEACVLENTLPFYSTYEL